MVTSARRWVTFSTVICDDLNNRPFIALVADPDVADCVQADVDELLDDPSLSALPQSSRMMCVRFVEEKHQQQVQECLSIYGRLPFLAIVYHTDDDEKHAYVFDLRTRRAQSVGAEASGDAAARQSVYPSNTHDFRGDANDGRCGADATDLRAFWVRVAAGTEPYAQQGAAPTLGDIFLPTHGVVLAEGRSAVTCTWQHLRQAAAGEGGGAVCVFWSDRCSCCPAVLRLMDVIVGILRRVAGRLACLEDGVGSSTGGAPLLLEYLACNIDDNEYPSEDWPCCQEVHPVVPCIVGYTHSGAMQRVPFTYPRTADTIMAFLLKYCVSPNVTLYDHICQEALRVCRALDTDSLMKTFSENCPDFKAAREAVQAAKEELDVHAARMTCQRACQQLVDVTQVVRDAAAKFKPQTADTEQGECRYLSPGHKRHRQD